MCVFLCVCFMWDPLSEKVGVGLEGGWLTGPRNDAIMMRNKEAILRLWAPWRNAKRPMLACNNNSYSPFNANWPGEDHLLGYLVSASSSSYT